MTKLHVAVVDEVTLYFSYNELIAFDSPKEGLVIHQSKWGQTTGFGIGKKSFRAIADSMIFETYARETTEKYAFMAKGSKFEELPKPRDGLKTETCQFL